MPRVPKRFWETNGASTHRTPASTMLDAHWVKLRLVERWTWGRYVRLCNFLRLTPWEMASAVQMPHKAVDAFYETGKLQYMGRRHVALLLTILEAEVLRDWTKDVIENPFPSLAGTMAGEPADDEPTKVSGERVGVAGGADRGSEGDADRGAEPRRDIQTTLPDSEESRTDPVVPDDAGDALLDVGV